MVFRRNLTINADGTEVEMAKERGINLSEMFRDTLRVKLQISELDKSHKLTDKQKVQKLETVVVNLTQTLRSCRERREEVERELKEIQKKEVKELENINPFIGADGKEIPR